MVSNRAQSLALLVVVARPQVLYLHRDCFLFLLLLLFFFSSLMIQGR